MTSTSRKSAGAKAAPRRRATSAPAPAPTPSPTDGLRQPLATVARQLRSWADAVLGAAGPVAELSMALAKGDAKSPRRSAAVAKAGAVLRQAREAAGLTAGEVVQAIDLRDAALLEQAESGKVALPFEVVLRLAGVLGRHDPIPFVMKLTRSYNPELWKAMEDMGVGRLAVQAGREREFANIYRSRDGARRLNDEDFALLVNFVNSAFDLALGMLARPRGQ